MVVWRDVGEGKQEAAFPSQHGVSLRAGTGRDERVCPVPRAGWTCGSSDPSPGQSHWCHVSSLTVPSPCLGVVWASHPAPMPVQHKESSRTSQESPGSRSALESSAPCHLNPWSHATPSDKFITESMAFLLKSSSGNNSPMSDTVTN